MRSLRMQRMNPNPRALLLKANGVLWCVLCSYALVALSSRVQAQTLGDVDGDGQATVLDIVRIVNHISGAVPLSAEAQVLADVNQDGTINDTDVALVAQAIAGLTTLPSLPLARVILTSPANGDSDVAVTRKTYLQFAVPLAGTNLITSSNLYATFGARRLLSRAELSSDGRTVTLFYLEPMPGGSRIHVAFDGRGLADFLGRPIDPDGDGQVGGTVTVDFNTLNLAPIPSTEVCGRVFASQLQPVPGSTNQFVNAPLAGVTITVDGREETMRAVTDQFGNFRLEPVPGGEFFVHIDGRTVTNTAAGIQWPNLAYYPVVGKKWQSIPQQEVNIGEIYLPLIPAGTLQAVSMTNTTVLSFSPDFIAQNPQFAGVEITVPPDDLYSENGVHGGKVGIAPVPPSRLPGPLPPGLPILDVVTIQTDGPANFDIPVAACFPNLQALPPGSKSALWSFNHDQGEWLIEGSMTVSSDGKLVCTDPGVGIIQPGWHGSRNGTQQRDSTPISVTQGKARRVPKTTRTQEHTKDDCDSDSVCKFGCTVLLSSGEERLERTDLAIAGRGDIKFVLQRVYRSQLDYNGPMGQRWNFSYNEGLFPQPNGDVMRMNASGHLDTWARQADGSYAAPAGHFRTLQQGPDGSFVLRSPDGFQRLYLQDGRLLAAQDRFGNRMTFAYDGRGNLSRVIDAYGREIDFQFTAFPDGVDRLTSVTDFIGRQVVYTYDGNGDLIDVRTPAVTGTSTGNDFPDGRHERYTYSSGLPIAELNHKILSLTLPQEVLDQGPPMLRWVYGTDPLDHDSFDCVIAETEGGTNSTGVAAGGTTTFAYQTINTDVPPGDPTVPRGKVTITMRNGNVWEYYANELNEHILTRQLTRGLRAGEPAYYETRSYYDADSQLLRRVFPAGNEVRFTYDQQGARAQQQNLIESRRIAGPRGGGEDLVTTYSYEPLYNRLASATDPRGNSASYAPPIGTASAERYTTHYFYDYQESTNPVPQAVAFGIDLSGVARGLGDLNSDGRTDQVFGNLVRVQGPAVHLRPDSNQAIESGSTTQQIIAEQQWNDHGQVTATIDAEGNVTDLIYYPENDPSGSGQPTPSRYLALTTAAAGYLQRTVVDSRTSLRRKEAAAPAALETAYGYDLVGNITSVRNPRGVLSTVEVNALNETVMITRGVDVSVAASRGQLLTGESALAYRTLYFRDANGRVVRQEVENRDALTANLPEFITTAYTYDILGNRIEASAQVDRSTVQTTRYRFDPEQLPILTILPEGNQIAMSYDERNLLFNRVRGFGSPDAATNRFDYDANGNLQTVLDAEDKDGDGQPDATRYSYDGFDRLVQLTDALDDRFTISYDVAGNVVARQAMGHPPGQPAAAKVLLSETSFSHDELNRTFQVDAHLFLSQGFSPARPVQLSDHNSDGFVTTITEYDGLGRTTFFVQDDLATTRYVYDGVGRLVQTEDPLHNTQSVDFDQDSNPTMVRAVEVSPESVVSNETFTTQYVYDQFDRLVRVTDNAGQTTRLAYDSRDNLVSRSDPEGAPVNDPLGLFPQTGQSGQINQPGNTISYEYDGLDRLLQQVSDLRVEGLGDNALDLSNPANPDGQITVSYAFDGNGRLVGVADDNGNRTFYTYDSLNRRISQINSDGTLYRMAYDRDSNLRTYTDPNGSVTTRTYDALSRLVHSQAANPPSVGGTTSEAYEYDGLSRLTKSSDDNGSSQSIQVCEFVYDSLSRMVEERQNGKATSTTWSGDGERLSYTYPGGRKLVQTFDALDRVKTISDQDGPIAQSSWIGPGYRELKRSNGNGTTLSFLNDAGNADVGYDPVQRIVQLRCLASGGAQLVSRTYSYNRAGMRLSEIRADDSGLTNAYAYDSAYRVVQSRLNEGGSPVIIPTEIDYLLDGVGNRRQVKRLGSTNVTESFSVNSVNEYTAVNGSSRFYDANGNLTDDGARTFRYDYRNRLIEVRDKPTGGPVARYLYFADNRRARKQVFQTSGTLVGDTAYYYDGQSSVEERDGRSDVTEATYTFSPVFMDEVVEMVRTAGHPLGPGTFYLHQDVRADVVALSDSTGESVEKTRYDDFGKPDHPSLEGNPYLFQGMRYDPETGLYWARNRSYDPNTGRFLQRDRVWDSLSAGNQYTYSGNNAVNYGDPFGLQGATPTPTPSPQPGGRPETVAAVNASTTAIPPPTKREKAYKIADKVYWRLKSTNKAGQFARCLWNDGSEFEKMRDKCCSFKGPTVTNVGALPSTAGAMAPGVKTQKDLEAYNRQRELLATTAREMGKIAKQEGWGNCQECSAVTATELHDEGFKNVEIMKKIGKPEGGREHVFVVIDRAPGSDPNDPKTWGKDALIVDGWDGVVIDPLTEIDKLAGVGDIQSIGLIPDPEPLPGAPPSAAAPTTPSPAPTSTPAPSPSPSTPAAGQGNGGK